MMKCKINVAGFLEFLRDFATRGRPILLTFLEIPIIYSPFCASE